MNQKAMARQYEIAYHEAGHVLIIHLLYGNLDFIECVHIDKVEDDFFGESKYGGQTKYTFDTLDELPSVDLFEAQEYGKDFVKACVLYAGGVAQKMMMQQDLLDELAMEQDIKEFTENCQHPEKIRIIQFAVDYCEKIFEKYSKCLNEIGEFLVQDTLSYCGGLVYKEELVRIIATYEMKLEK